jgi:hypothetical protein
MVGCRGSGEQGFLKPHCREPGTASGTATIVPNGIRETPIFSLQRRFAQVAALLACERFPYSAQRVAE